jgi:hypothetical protein
MVTYSYVRKTPTRVTEEQYTDVGSSFTLGDSKLAFLASSLIIVTTSGGTPLTRGTDYELAGKDEAYSRPAFEDEDVFSSITILNATYETGDLYVTYDAVFTYVDKSFVEEVGVDHYQSGGFREKNIVAAITWTSAVQVGTDTYIANTGTPALAALNGTDVAFIDSTNDDLRVYRFDGTDWTQVGNDLNISGASFPALAALNGTDVAFIDSVNEDLRVYRFDGTDWTQVGNDLNIAGAGAKALAAPNGTDVAFIDSINDDLRVYRFGWSVKQPYRPD